MAVFACVCVCVCEREREREKDAVIMNICNEKRKFSVYDLCVISLLVKKNQKTLVVCN